MSLLDQSTPRNPARARMVYGRLAQPRSKDIRRSLTQHRYYERNRDKKAADNARRYREKKERLAKLEQENRALRGLTDASTNPESVIDTTRSPHAQ